MKSYRSLSLAVMLLTAFSAQSETAIPQDVQRFIDEAEICQHLAGEWDPSLPEQQQKEIKAGVDEHCSKAEKQLPALRGKYSEEQDILAMISGYSL